MTIDILSDLHLDFYFRGEKNHADAVQKLYTPIFIQQEQRSVGNVLIVAGDLGHDNLQNIDILKHIKDIFAYKHIICLLGNHDYYLIDSRQRAKYDSNSFLRTAEMRELINNQKDMYCLDGNVIELEGVRFGGCDSWYDGTYTLTHFSHTEDSQKQYHKTIDDNYIHRLWNQTMNDAHYIYGMDWKAFSASENEKIETIYKNVDVMITHINPSIRKEHTDTLYQEEPSTGFFTFDGLNYLKNGSMKYWIFGHTHTPIEFNLEGVHCICNPMGYPGESDRGRLTKVKSIEIG